MTAIRIGRDEVAFSGRYIQVIRRHFFDRGGSKGVWEVVKRKTYGRIVAVVPVTPAREVILVSIYRIPLKSRVIEMCAGLMDKKGESETELARRELLEETGYAVGEMEKIAAGPFNAGLLADEMAVYAGFDAKKVQAPHLEGAEDIRVLKVPLRKMHAFLSNPPRGVKIDLKLFGVTYLLEKRFGMRA